jgi:hypothetical protein
LVVFAINDHSPYGNCKLMRKDVFSGNNVSASALLNTLLLCRYLLIGALPGI